MTVWLEIIAFHPPPSRRNYPLALFATLSFNYASTTIFLASPRLVHLHPNPAGSPLVIIFPRVAWSLVGFSSARKTAVISRFCDDRERPRASRSAKIIETNLTNNESILWTRAIKFLSNPIASRVKI